jgi:hypothetical protein
VSADEGMTNVLLIDGPLEGARTIILDDNVKVDDHIAVPAPGLTGIEHYFVTALFDITCLDCSRSAHRRVKHRKVIAMHAAR